MFPYILLITIPYVVYLICKLMSFKAVKCNKATLLSFFVVFLAVLSCRGITVGRDLVRYKYFFETCKSIQFKQLFDTFADEFGYYGLNWIIGRVSSDFQVLLVVIALVFTVVPLYQLYVRETIHPLMTISLFVGACPFAMYFSGLSQVTAMAFSIPIFYCCKNKWFKQYLILAVIAIFFHASGIMLLLMYPIYRLQFKRIHIPIIAAIIVGVYIYKEQLFSIVLLLAGKYDMYSQTERTNSYSMFVLYILFLAFTYIVVPAKEDDDEYIGLRNILILTVLIQCFVPIHHLVMRLNYYYLSFLPVLMSKTIEKSKMKNQSLAYIALAVITIFFTVYFFAGGINADNLDITPYVTAWK